MLRDLIVLYLDNLKKERAFDANFLALLVAEGFYDIHFTHGALEFGKDFIAKRTDAGVPTQYAFQNKAGNIGASEWRDIRHQMLETLTNDIGGPSFDPVLPRRAILVLTGRLIGTAGADHQEFSRKMGTTFPGRSIEPAWDRETLTALLLKHGPEQLFRTGTDIASYGSFYRLYGDIVERRAKVDDIEQHFEHRLHAAGSTAERVAAVALEAHLYADASISSGQPYLAMQAMQAEMGAVAFEIQSGNMTEAQGFALFRAARTDVLGAAESVRSTYDERIAAAGSLLEATSGAGLIVSYPVMCAQMMDALVLQHELGDDARSSDVAVALAVMVAAEPGCAHPISDRYAVSVVWAIRMLSVAGHERQARALLREAANWLINRYWDGGLGLASCDAGEDEEIATLLGGPFTGVEATRNSGSFLACTLMDAACFLQDHEVYNGLRADIIAAEIFPRYYQVQDSPGQFQYGADDIVRFPNIEFAPQMPHFEQLSHGSHLSGEPVPRRAADFGTGFYAGVSLLLRDRYFPKIWLMNAKLALASDHSLEQPAS